MSSTLDKDCQRKKMTEKQERYHDWVLRKLREMKDSDNETDN